MQKTEVAPDIVINLFENLGKTVIRTPTFLTASFHNNANMFESFYKQGAPLQIW